MKKVQTTSLNLDNLLYLQIHSLSLISSFMFDFLARVGLSSMTRFDPTKSWTLSFVSCALKAVTESIWNLRRWFIQLSLLFYPIFSRNTSNFYIISFSCFWVRFSCMYFKRRASTFERSFFSCLIRSFYNVQ